MSTRKSARNRNKEYEFQVSETQHLENAAKAMNRIANQLPKESHRVVVVIEFFDFGSKEIDEFYVDDERDTGVAKKYIQKQLQKRRVVKVLIYAEERIFWQKANSR